MSLLEGLAQWAAAEGHGVYRRGAVYGPDEVGIVLDDVVPAPARLLVLRPYLAGLEPDTELPYSEPYVQWRFRGGADRTDSADRAQRFWDEAHGAGPLTLPNGVIVMSIACTHPDPIPIGRDEAGRHEHTVNTRIDYVRPTTHRPA